MPFINEHVHNVLQPLGSAGLVVSVVSAVDLYSIEITPTLLQHNVDSLQLQRIKLTNFDLVYATAPWCVIQCFQYKADT